MSYSILGHAVRKGAAVVLISALYVSLLRSAFVADCCAHLYRV